MNFAASGWFMHEDNQEYGVNEPDHTSPSHPKSRDESFTPRPAKSVRLTTQPATVHLRSVVLRFLKIVHPAVVGLVCVLLGMSPGPDRPVTTMPSGQATYEKASGHPVDLAATRECEQLKIVPAPKLLQAGGPHWGGTQPIRPSTRTARAAQLAPPAPDLRKSTWVGVIVLRL